MRTELDGGLVDARLHLRNNIGYKLAPTRKARATTGAIKTKSRSSKSQSSKSKGSKSQGLKSSGLKNIGSKSSGSKSKSASRSAVASSSPLGMLALHLLEQWEKSGRDGLVFLCDDESRAERLGGVIHALDPLVEVLVFPRLNTLPFDGLEPSREIAGRRSAVLRRLAKAKKPVFLVSTAEAIMERLPLPASWSRSSLTLKVGAPYSGPELESRLEALGYDLDEEAEYPGGVLFHGKTFEVFPAGALAPFRIEHSGETIRKIVAVDPVEHEVVYETKELTIDPMSERIALGATRGQRATLPDYCGRARWIVDAGVSAHADSWLGTIEEAAGRRDAEREYLGQADWKRLKKSFSVLPRKAAFISTPEFSKLAAPRKALRAFVADMQRGGSRLLFVAAVEDDLRAMERMSGIKAERHADWSEVSKGRSREAALLADFDAGFIGTGRKPLVVVTASDVLGSRAHHPQPMARSWNPAFDHPDVPEKGAAIVHLQRGLAVLDGLQTLDMGRGSRREMVRLAFAGDNAVLVPPSDLAVIWPYAGEPGKLTLDKADGSSWWARRTEAEGGNSGRRQGARQTHQPAPPPPCIQAGAAGGELRKIRRAFPLFHDGRSGQGDSGRPRRSGVGPSHGQGDLRRRRIRQDRGGAARSGRGGAVGQAGGDCGADDRAGTAACRNLPQTVRPARDRGGKPVAGQFRPGDAGDEGRAAAWQAESRGRHAGSRGKGREVRRSWPRHHRRRAAFRRGGEDEAFRTGKGCSFALDERHADPAHARCGSCRLQGSQRDRLAAGSSPSHRDQDRAAFGSRHCRGAAARAQAERTELPDLSAHPGSGAGAGAGAIGGAGAAHRLSARQIARRGDRRPDDEFRRRRSGCAAGDQYRGKRPRHTARQHHRGVLARKVRAWHNCISSGGGWDAAARARLPIC
ncbi:hypothetical protein ACVWWG_001185 [Bradyrhizobium sp. LB7.2]